jgi:tRNA(His) 5'-end guanylyltransferase
MAKDKLSIRIKEFYENRTRYYLPRRTYTVIRVDGKSFHSFTRGLEKPFDNGLVYDMDETAIYLCKNIQGAKLAFVQSDEISIILTDFDKITTDAWFDGNIQKMVSISASMATSKFNQLRTSRKILSNGNISFEDFSNLKLAEFDSRVFTIPALVEVYNYLIFRQNDTVRNSISSVAQSLYSHTELEKKNQSDMQEMCFQKGVNWNDFDPKVKNGRLIIKIEEEKMINDETIARNEWKSVAAPTFTKDKTILENIFKINEEC